MDGFFSRVSHQTRDGHIAVNFTITINSTFYLMVLQVLHMQKNIQF